MKLQQELAELSLNADEITSLERRLEQIASCWGFTRGLDIGTRSPKASGNVRKASDRSGKTVAKSPSRISTRTGKNWIGLKPKKWKISFKLKARENALATAKVYAEQRDEISQELVRFQKILSEKTTELAAVQKKWQQIRRESTVAKQQVQQTSIELEKYPPTGDRLDTLKQVAPLLMEWQLIDRTVQKNSKNSNKTLHQKLNISTLVLKEAQSQQELANSAVDRSREALATAEATNAEATRLNQAAVLRESLVSGATCPVCGGGL